jgi:hypothetical protein
MQNVVGEVTGRYVNGDYRLSYLNAGATEVPLAQAQSGDIIQLADDKHTEATANYPGLHTAFVMENHGDGTFKVIDSNYLYDHVVRVHDDYDPLVSAGRYQNIAVHVYRFPPGKVQPTPTAKAGARSATAATVSPSATPTPTPDETPEVRAEPLAAGTTAVIAADGDCLRIRDRAGLAGKEVACLPSGSLVRVLDGTKEVDGYRWQLIQSGSVVGWAADMYLAPSSTTVSASSVAAGGQAAPPTPEPTPAPAILSGEAPPAAGGYALFVFSGGTDEDLLTVSGCDPATATFWATNPSGQIVWYLPAVTVAAVNAPWEGMFAGQIPEATALMGRCQ